MHSGVTKRVSQPIDYFYNFAAMNTRNYIKQYEDYAKSFHTIVPFWNYLFD